MAVCDALIECYSAGGKLLVCGNGGSCADAEHITGELMKGFLKNRPVSIQEKENMKALYPEISDDVVSALQKGLPTIPLSCCGALASAFANDCNPGYVYAQQVYGYGKLGDAFLGISTSGNAENVCAAAAIAKSMGLFALGLSGRDGGELKKICDVSIVVDESETFKIQELHLPVYHAICAYLEEYFFSSKVSLM